MTARVVSDGEAGRVDAVSVLRAGGVIALPTDTVYGLGVALPTPGGIERLFHVKRRPPERGIVLLLADPAQMGELAIVTPAAEALAAALWPGGLTLILEQRPDVTLPAVLTGGATTIGLRVPDHDAPRALARALGPLPVTSANVSGEPEAPDAPSIIGQLGDDIELVLDGGPATGGPASTVVDATGERIRILRPGAVSPDRLGAVLEVAGLPSDVAG
jgi:L-threonylcarbamoyladenylate synthase